MLSIKIHKSYRNVVAISDLELIGKKFEEGRKQIDLTGSFFKGDEVGKDEAIRLIQSQAGEDASFNIVGKEAIEAADEAGIIEKKCVGYVQGIPLILIF